MWKMFDDNHDGKADRKEILFQGIGGEQHDHGAHAFVFGPDGKLYFNFGNEGKQLLDAKGKPVLDQDGDIIGPNKYKQGMVFRCNLDGSKVECLGHNFRNNYEVVGVITAVDKPAGRGQRIKFSAVKEYALKNELKLLQPTNLKDDNFLTDLKSLNANLQVVVAFRMLPEAVWRMPKLGTFNLHASLLPNYRGAAPINWAIINGESETGVTTFFIDDKIDTGAMILNAETAIGNNESAGELHDRLMQLGSETVTQTLALLENGKVTTTIQEDNAEIKTAYKLNKENCKKNS